METSSDIIVIRCEAPRSNNTPLGGPIRAEISVVDVLKGETNGISNQLSTHTHLHKNEYYLVFANYSGGCYQAKADYDFVPIEGKYDKEMAVGKDTNEKVRALLKRRLNYLKVIIPIEQAEKQRLEQAFK